MLQARLGPDKRRSSTQQGVHVRCLHPGIKKTCMSRVPVTAAEVHKAGQKPVLAKEQALRYGVAGPTAHIVTASASSGTCLSC